MLRSLLWKEWREHRWKALSIFLTCLVLLVASWLGGYEFAVFQMAIYMLALLIVVFLAMETVTEERTHRTRDITLSLPLPAGIAFYHKCLWNLAVGSIPVLAVQLLGYYVFYGEKVSAIVYQQPVVPWILLVPSAACSLYAWIVLVCARFHSQLKVAIAALLIFLAHIVILVGFTFLGVFDGHSPTQPGPFSLSTICELALSVLTPFSPFIFADRTLIPFLLLTAAGTIMNSLLLLIPASRRYGGSATWSFPRRSPAAPAILPTRPRRFPILWKTWAESRLFVRLYLFAAVLFLGISIYYARRSVARGVYFDTFVSYMLNCLSYGSLFTALILAGDIGMADFEHRLDLFWQSRPIQPARYFYKRYASGLLLSIATFVLPALLFVLLGGILFTAKPLLADDRNLQNFDLYLAGLRYLFRAVEYEAFWTIPMLSLLYGMSVFAAAFIRQRILAMLLTALLFPFMLPLGSWTQEFSWHSGLLFQIHDWVRFPPYHIFFYLLCFLATLALVNVLLARLASLPFTNDWKHKLEQFLARSRPSPSPQPLPQTH